MANIISLETFHKRKPFLVGIDSDGCAMDAMNSKHIHCFGPAFISHWNLKENADYVQTVWNEVNLFSFSRGVNRFKGLVIVLKRLCREGLVTEDFSEIEEWVNDTEALSNAALEEAVLTQKSSQLEKALHWSSAVNALVAKMKDLVQPFANLPDALRQISDIADIAIISSANREALVYEWNKYNLMNYINCLCTQEDGSKERCLKALLSKGFSPQNVLMVGDSLGDQAAAANCGVWFYPIIAGKESECWRDIISKSVKPMISHEMNREAQAVLIQRFRASLHMNIYTE